MYFTEKGDTNIDDKLKEPKKFDFNKYKKFIIIGVAALVLLILLIIIIASLRNRTSYHISLNGGSEINVYKGIAFVDPGYKAFDNKNHIVTDQVKVNGNVQTDTLGTYKITYSIGNKTVVRTVNVITSQSQFTSIHLEGSKEMTISLGSEYVEPGYYYNDIIKGDIRDQIKVDGSVNTSVPGKYRLIYTVVNSENVTITAERVVTVE